MKWCELREYKWNEYVTIAVNRNLSNCEKARKKGFRGFNGIRTRGLCVSAAVLYQPDELNKLAGLQCMGLHSSGWSWRFKFGEISEDDSQIFRRTWRISGPEVADGAKPDVPTTDRQNEKKTRNFQTFLSDDGNESLQYNPPLPPSLDSTYKDTWRKSWLQKVGKAPNDNRPGHASHDVMWRI